MFGKKFFFLLYLVLDCDLAYMVSENAANNVIVSTNFEGVSKWQSKGW